MSTSAGWQDYAPQAQGWQDYQEPKTAPKTTTQPSATDPGEIPLTSHWAATEQGLNRIGEGAQHAVEGAARAVMHPIDTAKSLVAAPGNFIHQIGQVPGAIRDINASEDPTGSYLQAAGRTAGEGAGQALISIAGAKAPEAVGSLPLGRIARTGGKLAMGAAEDVPIARQFVRIGKYWKETEPPPVFSKTRLGPEEAPTGIPLISKTRLGPEPAPPGPPPVFSKTRLGPDEPPPEVIKARGLGRPPEADPAEGLGRIPAATAEPPATPSSFPPDEPTGRFQIPRPSKIAPERADILEDHGVQQDMRDYLDRQGKEVYKREPLGKSKQDMAADFNEGIGKSSPVVKPRAAVQSETVTPQGKIPNPIPRASADIATDEELSSLKKSGSAVKTIPVSEFTTRQPYLEASGGKSSGLPEVYQTGDGKYVVLDGNHRVAEALQNGEGGVKVKVWKTSTASSPRQAAIVPKDVDLTPEQSAAMPEMYKMAREYGNGDPLRYMVQELGWNKAEAQAALRLFPDATAASPKSAATNQASVDLTPEWQAELDRVKAQKAKKDGR